ncbi:MAG: RluA family pseudouridine synthase [Ruminiclostridium sp.]|nr:RluA family pseudouridine synthase [Ruminiclostridium sp.]
MRTVTVGRNSAGQRLDRFLQKMFPAMSQGIICRLIRKKDIKVGGKRTEPAYKLCEGDVVSVYAPDALLCEKPAGRSFMDAPDDISVIYEDENILLADKEPGLLVHEDDGGSGDTLIDRVKKYLYSKGEYRPEDEQCFAPALCNRIDRNTGGIVIAAKNAESLRVLNQKIRDRELTKLYLCAVQGVPEPREAELKAYLFKDSAQNRVIISDKKTPENRTIITKYRVLEINPDGDSLLEVDLITGRTHQIRAHMAYAGHPLLGDGKYGSNRANRERGYKYQALYSYKLRFRFTTDAGILSYLDGREFEAKNIWFIDKFKKGTE